MASWHSFPGIDNCLNMIDVSSKPKKDADLAFSNYLTATSLRTMVNKGNHPLLWPEFCIIYPDISRFSHVIIFCWVAMWPCWPRKMLGFMWNQAANVNQAQYGDRMGIVRGVYIYIL